VDVLVTFGSQASLRCDALGLPKPDIVWLKDEESFPILSERSRYVQLGGSLQFLSVRVEDSGMYQCVASNKAGTVRRNFTLSVYGKFMNI